MKRRVLAILASMTLAATIGVGTTLARSDSTVTETCSNGTTAVYTTVDGSAVNPGNFEVGSGEYSSNNPQGYVCWIS